jgi:hypothetical protein
MKPNCWWCCHAFEWEALHWPYKYIPKTQQYHSTGYFCSWECIKAYAIDRGELNTCEFITHMRLKLEGSPVKTTKTAPRKEVLEMFGGPVCIEDFRKEPELITTIMKGEVYQLPVINVGKFEKKDDVSIGIIKLKRTKPLERLKGSLESSLGITRKKVP